MSGRKARRRARDRRRVAAVFLSLVIIFVAVLVFVVFQSPSSNFGNGLRAIIVDQLSLTFPNQTFVKTATDMLNQSGYSVDYYSGEKTTVGFYRNLMASNSYKIIILRVHSGIAANFDELAFFTSENYSEPTNLLDPNWGDVWHDRIGEVTYHDPPSTGETAYFAIRYRFVEEYGKFNGTTVIVMGCYGMKYTSMAQAFMRAGAKVYIGWDGLENADHADEAAVTLLKNLVLDKQTVSEAVQNTMDSVKPDPMYGSQLGFFPPDSGNQRVQTAAATVEQAVASVNTETWASPLTLSHTRRTRLSPAGTGLSIARQSWRPVPLVLQVWRHPDCLCIDGNC
jgi:hypothetical protein